MCQYTGKTDLFDPTKCPNPKSAYMNHSTHPNLQTMKPVIARGRVRVGFVAKTDVKEGEELMWDYGIRDAKLSWTLGRTTSKRKHSSTGSEDNGSRLQHRPTLVPDSSDSDDEANSNPQVTMPKAVQTKPKGKGRPSKAENVGRVSRTCPIVTTTKSGLKVRCGAFVKRLANHLKSVHRNLTAEEHAQALGFARASEPVQAARRKARGEATSDEFVKREVLVVSDEDFGAEIDTANPPAEQHEQQLRQLQRKRDAAVEENRRAKEEKNPFTSEPRSTNRVRQQDKGKSIEQQRQRGPSLRQHDLDSEPLKNLKQHLESRMGANLEATTVEQHIRSLAKLLFYVNPVCCSLSSIFEAEKIADYLEKMKACGVGPYGQQAKVDACVQALKFMQNCQEHDSADKIGCTMAMFDRFKSRLRKERRQENLRRDEEGRMEVDGSTIDERLSNPALSLWAERVLLLCKIDPALLSEEDVSFTYQYLLAWLTLDNSQRPGPAINMTGRPYVDTPSRHAQQQPFRALRYSKKEPQKGGKMKEKENENTNACSPFLVDCCQLSVVSFLHLILTIA